MFAFLAQLLCCGARPRATPSDVQSTVIPNEHSRLLDEAESSHRPAIVVDHQKLSDRLGTIVRAKEGKMVSVSARTPFTLRDAEPVSSVSASNPDIGGSRVNISRRPPVLTMTPTRSHGSLRLHSDSQSRHSSRSGSRSSSRQPVLRSHSAHSSGSARRSTTTLSVPASASTLDTRGKALDTSEWFAESDSEYSVEDQPASPILGATPIAQPTPNLQSPPDVGGIAFDWDA
ncbi:hypothetical protein K438DRAFT_827642 [Mycena galopus ATCC 62051]|nr:hypothetical protein K438DRAFT_827642 [Mycena galopus ATCC 62051]